MSLPQHLGRLRRISRIGSGGFATVWLYSDPVLQSRVAVKALADNWASRTDVRDRFLEEARILRRADSDNVVRVYDLGETDDGTPYFVMNYADRGTVSDLLNASSRDLSTIADLVAQACTGLARLHAMGILHRDVKPQNLLLSGDHAGATRLMVADLGVAKAILHASGITQVVGTPAYMAPEQADPTRGVDERCDVHALGAVAYHLVTGRPMRTGGFESLYSADPIPPPTTLVPDLPSSLDDVVLRAVAYEPEARWPDMMSFSAAFADAVTKTQTQSYQPPRVEASVWEPGPMSPPRMDSPAPRASTDSPYPVDPRDGFGPPGRQSAWLNSSAERRAADRRRGVLATLAALAAVAVVMGGAILWQRAQDGTDSSTAPPSIALSDEWSGPEEQGDSTWQYVNSSADLELEVSTAISQTSVQDEATTYLDSIAGAGSDEELSQALGTQRLGDWQTGWELRYTESGDTAAWRWYLGNANPETAGWVEVKGPSDVIEGEAGVEDLLTQARDDALIGIAGTD